MTEGPITGQQVSTGEEPKSTSPEAAPESKEAKLTAQFAAMARKQKAITARSRSIEEQERALKAKEAEYQSNYIPKSALSEDPIGYLLKSGFSAQQLAQILISKEDPQSDELSQIRSEMKRLTDAQEASRVSAAESEKKAHERARSMVLKDVVNFTRGNEEFETINALDAHDSVVELMEKTLEEEDYLPTFEDAAKEVEAYLREDMYSRVSKLKKVQERLKPTPESSPDQKQNQSPEKQSAMTTLSNRQTTSVPKGLSMKERIARAVLAGEGKLN